MAFASVGTLGTATTKVASATLALTPTAGASAGDIVVVMVAELETHISGGSLLVTGIEGITDSKGNVYSMLVSGQGTQNADGSQGGGGIFISLLTTAITVADTITLTEAATVPHTAKAMTAWRFTTGASKWALWAQNGSRTAAGTDPPAITVTPGTSQQYLLLHVLASQGPNTDAYTEQAGYTSVTAAGTVGGLAATNMTAFGGFRIATLTTDTVDVALVPAENVYQGYVAIAEYTDALSFPQNGVIDDFNRADESPLSNGTWIDTATFPSESPGTSHTALVSNAATADVATTNLTGQWVAQSYSTESQEAYATLTAKPTTTGDAVAVLCSSKLGGSSTFLGCQARWALNPSGAGVDFIRLGWAGQLGGQGFTLVYVALTVGYKFAVRHIHPITSCWVDTGSGWRWVSAFMNTTVQNGQPGSHVGLQVQRQVARLDDFGGGPLPPTPGPHTLPYLGVGA